MSASSVPVSCAPVAASGAGVVQQPRPPAGEAWLEERLDPIVAAQRVAGTPIAAGNDRPIASTTSAIAIAAARRAGAPVVAVAPPSPGSRGARAPSGSAGRLPALAEERQVQQPEHVGGRQKRGQTASAHSTVCPCAKVCQRISSFEKNPESSGTPAMASVPIRNVQ